MVKKSFFFGVSTFWLSNSTLRSLNSFSEVLLFDLVDLVIGFFVISKFLTVYPVASPRFSIWKLAWLFSIATFEVFVLFCPPLFPLFLSSYSSVASKSLLSDPSSRESKKVVSKTLVGLRSEYLISTTLIELSLVLNCVFEVSFLIVFPKGIW